MMWFAILVTVFAATGNNIGKALQKEAVHTLPRFSLYPGVLRQYLRSRLWLIGLAADLGGALLMIAAFALAPVSLVQPVSGLGLVSLAIFTHFHLKERLVAEEWGAVAMAMLGTLGLGLSSEDAPREAAEYGMGHYVVLALVLTALLAALLAAGRLTSLQKRKSVSGARTAASVNGLQAGVCFGLSAACCKTGILLVNRLGWTAFPLGLACSVLISSLGFMLQTLGLKDGNTVIVCTCAAVTSMATGVLVGLLAMGEPLPSAVSMKLLRLLSWLVTIAGVTALANGKGSFLQVVRLLAGLLPGKVQPFAAMLTSPRKSAGKDLKLPTTETDCNI